MDASNTNQPIHFFAAIMHGQLLSKFNGVVIGEDGVLIGEDVNKYRDRRALIVCTTLSNISMAENDAYAAYHRLPSFIKVFCRRRDKDEMVRMFFEYFSNPRIV